MYYIKISKYFIFWWWWWVLIRHNKQKKYDYLYVLHWWTMIRNTFIIINKSIHERNLKSNVIYILVLSIVQFLLEKCVSFILLNSSEIWYCLHLQHLYTWWLTNKNDHEKFVEYFITFKAHVTIRKHFDNDDFQECWICQWWPQIGIHSKPYHWFNRLNVNFNYQCEFSKYFCRKYRIQMDL